MDISVSRIKVTLPRRRNDLLSRPRLNALVDELLEARLILITAPAGYGKTSILIEKAHTHELPFCWFNLDELDQELYRFIAHFVAAIDQRFPGFEKNCSEAVQTAFQNNVAAEPIARMLANEVYQFIREHLVLVLDNYHLVQASQAVNTFVNRFTQEADENFHLVIVSRSLLPLADLPLLVARSQVGGFDFHELAFTPDEIQKLMLQNYSQVIPDAIAVELAQRTEGWITGLLLSAQTMWQGMADRERVARVSGVKLYDYLIHQILEQQPPELRDFLLRTSLFEEFNADLCKAVLGEPPDGPSWQPLIQKAIHYNLFVLPIDEEGRWLRYHHLFRDFLQHSLAQEQPEEEQRLLRSLVDVYTQQKDWERAYATLIRLEDTAATADFLEKAGEPLVQANQLTRLAEWLDALPRRTLETRPVLLARRGIVAATLGETHWGLELLDRAASALRADSDPAHLAGTLVWRALVYHIQGNYPASLLDLEEVLEMAESGNVPARLKAEAHRIIGLNFRLSGERDKAAQNMKTALELFQEQGDTASVVLLWLSLGALYLDTGELKAGLECLTSAREHYQKEKNTYALASVLNDIGFLHYLRGEYEPADGIFSEALAHARASGNRRVEALVLTGIGDLYIDLDLFQAAESVYNQAAEVTERIGDQFLSFYLVVAKTGLARLQGNINQAHRFLDTANEMAQRNPTKYTQALYLMEAGRLALVEEEPAAACCFLEEAAQLFSTINQRVEASRANFCLAMANFETGDLDEAARCLGVAFQIAAALDNPHTLVPGGRRGQRMMEALSKNPLVSSESAALIQAIPQYDQAIAVLRQRLRRQKSSAAHPQAAPKLIIQALGAARVTLNKKTITSTDWQSQKARELFFLLLSSDRGWSKEAIGEMLWPDSSPAQLKLRFKNTAYRIRRILGPEAILFDNERYSFNRKLDYVYDVEVFVDCLVRADKAANSQERSAAYQEAIQVYNGKYLPEISGTWASVEREHLQQAFVEIRLKLASTNLEVGEFHSAISICNNLILEDPMLEEAHRVAMRAYAAMGNRTAIIQQYNMLKNKMLVEMGITPSLQTETLFQKLVH